jgi:hypothetical protein
MDSLVPTLIGTFLMGLPVIVLAWFLFRRQRPIFFFALALTLMGLGYLATTQAPISVARTVMGTRN